jgi:FtsP/CotA-like multicopper oxidase with cupredoxin domain
MPARCAIANANACDDFARRDQRSSVSRSTSDNTNSAFGRPVLGTRRAYHLRHEFRARHTSAEASPTPVRQDVVLIPANGWARLRIPFTDHPGRSVYHCHMLDHEDLGMMATVNVRS